MNKIDKIAKRKELLENGYSFDFKRSIDENGEVKSEEIWVEEKWVKDETDWTGSARKIHGFYIQRNEFNLKAKRVFDCFDERLKLKQYKKKRHVIQFNTKEKFDSYTWTLKNIDPFLLGRCYWGRKKVMLSTESVKIEVELTEFEYTGEKWGLVTDERKKEIYNNWDCI